MKRYAQGKN